MNYAWIRADRAAVGMLCYVPHGDSAITEIEAAGDLHVRIFLTDGDWQIFRRDHWLMVQCCHRRCYEDTTHHAPINDVARQQRLERSRLRRLGIW